MLFSKNLSDNIIQLKSENSELKTIKNGNQSCENSSEADS